MMMKEEFKRRFLSQFQDQNFDRLTAELESVAEPHASRTMVIFSRRQFRKSSVRRVARGSKDRAPVSLRQRPPPRRASIARASIAR
jgi:hypothetical protein